MKHFEFEYGAGTMGADLPDYTDEFIPGVTVPDPDYIPEDRLEAAYRESLDHPIGMPTVKELAHKGSKVVFVVPDRVKGGEQPTSHRKLSIKYILQDLYSVGVEKQDILRCAQRHRELLAAYETQDEEKIIRALQKHYDVGANEDDRKQDERPFNEILRFFEGTPA